MYFLNHNKHLDIRLQMVEQALENLPFLFSFAKASAAISSAQHEKSSISTFYNRRHHNTFSDFEAGYNYFGGLNGLIKSEV